MSLYLYPCLCYPASKAQETYYPLICGLSGSYISTLSHKHHDVRQKKGTKHKLCFDFPDNFCPRHLIFYEKFSEMLS